MGQSAPMARYRNFYTTREAQELRVMAEQGLDSHEIGAQIGRSPCSVRHKARKMGVTVQPRNYKIWTKREINYLFASTTKHTMQYVAKKLGRSAGSVKQKAHTLGIKWYQGRRSIRSVARDVGISPQGIDYIIKKRGLWVQRRGNFVHVPDKTYFTLLEYYGLRSDQ